jgi:hypothetical protein
MKQNINKITILAALCAFSGCNTETEPGTPEPNQKRIEVALRPDAVEPPVPVDVEYSIGSEIHSVSNAAPGALINLGPVPVNTTIRFRVYNRSGAGQVRANILTNNCFRNTGKCNSPNCVAEAQYEVIEEECPNY